MDHTLKLIDNRMNIEVHTFEDDTYINSHKTNKASISHSGKYAMVGSRNGNVVVLDLVSGKVEEVLKY